MVAYKYRIPAGIPGAVNRTGQSTIEAQVFDAAFPVLLYGVPVKIVSGLVRPIASGDAASLVYGFLARPYPANSSQDGLGVGVPVVSAIADVMRRGYMTVKLNNVTAATKNGAVYVRNANAGAGTPIGGLEAGATDTVLIPGAYFMGPADADGNVEIAYNI